MKSLHTLTAAAVILLALAGPTLAAQRANRGFDAYASGTADRSGAYYSGPQGGESRAQDTAREGVSVQPQYGRGQNLPYADRPYGSPDNW
jgi:hypothetical protein